MAVVVLTFMTGKTSFFLFCFVLRPHPTALRLLQALPEITPGAER